jgi:hypothetical protein
MFALVEEPEEIETPPFRPAPLIVKPSITIALEPVILITLLYGSKK